MSTIQKAVAAATNDGAVTCLEIAAIVVVAVPLIVALLVVALALGPVQ